VPIKDPTSDMAQFARKGSNLVRSMREQREKQKAVKESLKDVKVPDYYTYNNKTKVTMIAHQQIAYYLYHSKSNEKQS